MASNKHAQIRYKVLDDCFCNFRRKFYFNDLLSRCNEALRELYGEKHSGIKTRTLRSDISYMRDRAGESGVEIEVIDDGSGKYYRYSEKDFSIYKHGLGEDDLSQLKETIMMLQRFNGMPNLDWMSELVVKLEDKLNLRGSSQSVVGYDENKLYLSSISCCILPKLPQSGHYQTTRIIYLRCHNNFRHNHPCQTLRSNNPDRVYIDLI